jgi:hypothetical protein
VATLSIEGETELSEQDFREAFGFVPQFRRSNKLWLVAPLLLLLAFSDEKLGRSFWLPALPLLGFLGLSLGFRWYLRRAWARRALADLGGGTTQFRFDETGLNVVSKLRRLELTWASLPQHVETPSSFIVYTGSQALLVLPKRAFAAADLEQLRAELRRRIPTKPYKNRLQALLLLWVVLIVTFLAIWHFLGSQPPP